MLTWEYPPRSVGGLAEHVFHLSRALAARRVEVHVVSAGLPDAPPLALEDGVHVHRVPGYGPAAPDFLSWVLQMNLGLAERASALILGGGAGGGAWLAHAHDWLAAFAGRLVKHAFHVPLVATIHATEAGRHGGIHTAEQRFISDAEWWLTYEAWRVVCCSRYMAGQVRDFFRVPADKLAVVANGVDAAAYARLEPTGAPRAQFAGPGEPLVLFIGRLVPEKGAQLLVQAAPRILAAFPRARFVIAGTGPYLDHLRNMAGALGVRERLRFTGYVSDETRRNLYQYAAVAAFPSLYEPFGIVALEAMAAGTPVVVADSGGLAEIVRDGEDGLRVPPGSAVALGAAVTDVLRNEGLARRLASGGRARVEADFRWEDVAGDTVGVYEAVMAEYAASPWRGDAAGGDAAGSGGGGE
jgi:glycogen(starch) synthase